MITSTYKRVSFVLYIYLYIMLCMYTQILGLSVRSVRCKLSTVNLLEGFGLSLPFSCTVHLELG